ncbi:MAG: TRAP transporter small permease [Phycisphaeraceae bacterium]
MMGIAVTTAIGVVFRYLINSPLFWTDEISRYALVWMTFLGGALLVGQSDGHVRVDFFVERMGRAGRRIAVVLSTFVEVAIVLLATAGGVIWLQASSRATSAAVGIPMPLVYAVIPLSGLAALAFILSRFLGSWKAEAGDR